MKKLHITKDSGFKVLYSHKNLQAAEMTLSPGASTGGAKNMHTDSDQWLLVIEGTGKAIIEGKQVMLGKLDLIVIEAMETHEIQNTGSSDLVTLNFYSPPEY